ncbi:hypothetical protein ACLK19_21050 [Escherichia coli]
MVTIRQNGYVIIKQRASGCL